MTSPRFQRTLTLGSLAAALPFAAVLVGAVLLGAPSTSNAAAQANRKLEKASALLDRVRSKGQ